MVRRSLLVLVLSALLAPRSFTGEEQVKEAKMPFSRSSDRMTGVTQVLSIGGATIEVDLVPGNMDVQPSQLLSWIERGARAVTVYYGRFPVQRVCVQVIPDSGQENSIHGTTWRNVGGFQGFIRMRIGRHVTERDLADDWTMTHEFVHTALSSLPDSQSWMEEGLATYVEPIARAQAGQLPVRQVWAGMILGMWQGQPHRGDLGLDQTHSWGRTYWGGAMFCLVADVEIRRKTENRKGLQNALRAIVATGGTIDKQWPLLKVLGIGDKATGTTVLVDMYNQWKNRPITVDLEELWLELGIRRSGTDGVVLAPRASLSAIRAAITTRPGLD
ncbi:hypothetical protein ACPOL_3326 [Acidisarcina polymorpha]|uniref:Peptidase MA-like domain-containing protein n=1 Tax=Acidisarcina polymorpha TaxID=2211140 RepID=A0A2Z5G1K0_9BACT|nr:hypothetical protein [Acidisarcina polymorpha]AXC12617.1 hypothetical protein ACPOL_3326 [Acidisarcina polymorpha]